jgi:hypothetical protein
VKNMNLGKWFKARGPRVVWQRATALLDRYGLASAKAAHRIGECVETLAELGCAPTFPTPGIVVQRYPQFIRHLQDVGAEIAVHSYQHIDLSALPAPVARQQLERAVQTFERFEIKVHGFRCPYLGYSTELLDSLPVGMFDYSSNEAIGWEPANLAANQSQFYKTLCRFYKGRPASDTVCLPSTRSNLIEIPVCVPDDLQLHDGCQLDPEGIGQAWSQILDLVYRRGELFTLMFHPELASFCESPFVSLLRRAHQCRPSVWVARLRDVSEWWREKSSFKVESVEIQTGLRLTFTCSPRATILVRGLDPGGSGQAWDGAYYRLESRILDVPADPLPFVGLPTSAPGPVVSFLQEQGYIVDMSDTAARCAIYLDVATLDRMTQVQLVNHIEALPGPLVRYWRWPNGAKSALCITGDLDALTLLDYASRLWTR